MKKITLIINLFIFIINLSGISYVIGCDDSELKVYTSCEKTITDESIKVIDVNKTTEQIQSQTKIKQMPSIYANNSHTSMTATNSPQIYNS